MGSDDEDYVFVQSDETNNSEPEVEQESDDVSSDDISSDEAKMLFK